MRGDRGKRPWLAAACRAAGLAVEAKDDAIFRFGELDVDRVRRILAGDSRPEAAPPRGRPPELCSGCPHRSSFEVLKELDCIVAGISAAIRSPRCRRSRRST